VVQYYLPEQGIGSIQGDNGLNYCLQFKHRSEKTDQGRIPEKPNVLNFIAACGEDDPQLHHCALNWEFAPTRL
jgi:hypothetical protein